MTFYVNLKFCAQPHKGRLCDDIHAENVLAQMQEQQGGTEQTETTSHFPKRKRGARGVYKVLPVFTHNL